MDNLLVIGGTTAHKKKNTFFFKKGFEVYFKEFLKRNKVHWYCREEEGKSTLSGCIKNKNFTVVTYSLNIFSIIKIYIKILIKLFYLKNLKIIIFPSPILFFLIFFLRVTSKKFFFYLGVDFERSLNFKQIRNNKLWLYIYKQHHTSSLIYATSVIVRGENLYSIAKRYNNN